ncbi:hypothetical protein GCM10010329_65980 [Streptomyces spiroverticillatus]|uniref:Uncharacterized protein n=1 Tax=Streptomyces finlayi TaxID=67296 RepID=A0A919CDJ5_9ACTN|nr:hypothetical protein GCM10010329_65980 [Streptomyces spiroverticillatus]GHD11451.1 hypothetical protein GCM10010334_67530 [Streptomyces finlayi]
MQFDAVRIEGDAGRRVAAMLEEMTGGDPGPIVVEVRGVRAVYFLVRAGSTGYRAWPPGVTVLNSGPNKVSYVPVPALDGGTWPLTWWCPPSSAGRRVHLGLLAGAADAVLVTASGESRPSLE